MSLTRGLIAHHEPVFLTAYRPTQGEMYGTIFLLGHIDMMPEQRLACRQRNTIHFARTFPLAVHPKTPFDPNTPVPTQFRQMCHQLRVGESPIRRKHDGTPDKAAAPT